MSKKTVDSVLSTFTKAIIDLDAIVQQKGDEAADLTKVSLQAAADAGVASLEATRAQVISAKIAERVS